MRVMTPIFIYTGVCDTRIVLWHLDVINFLYMVNLIESITPGSIIALVTCHMELWALGTNIQAYRLVRHKHQLTNIYIHIFLSVIHVTQPPPLLPPLTLH